MSDTLPLLRESAALAETERPESLLAVIARAVADPRMDVEKMAKLLDMHERIVADQRRVAFAAAMSRLAPKLPEIDQNGRVVFEGKNGAKGQDRKYARLEDIDRAIRPLLSEEGFSLSFDTAEGPGGKIRVSGKLSHSEGHSETKQLDLPHDSSGSKNPVQAVGSTVSYGRRMLCKMFFNLIERGEDTNGETEAALITPDQALEINTLIQDTKSDVKSFLEKIAGYPSIAEIPAIQYRRVMNALETKQRGMQK